MEFNEMNLDERILRALKDLDFEKPTEIQEKSLPAVMQGQDVIGQSMTGSGKTLVFGAPIVQKIYHGNGIQALILAPTRELADQIATTLRKYSKYMKVDVCEVIGGVAIEPQIAKLRHTDIVVGTPGRILDHMERGTIGFGKIKFFVLDEADRMLDMGFIDDIKRIMSHLPKERQTMLFSATIPPEVDYLAHRFMKHPVKIKTQSFVSTQKLKQFYYDVKKQDKISLLVHLINKEKPRLAIVFCSTRRMANIVGDVLEKQAFEAKTIHGGMTQSSRMNILEGFHRGKPHILVATDVAARGLDIENVSHIFNYDLPQEAKNYTHRIGRTARIGKEGKVITLLSQEDHPVFQRIVRTHEVKKLVEHEYPKIKAEYSEHHYDRYHDYHSRRRQHYSRY
jgi:ATP-dependent RNA helicase DeaD